jgi:hypothetical protein
VDHPVVQVLSGLQLGAEESQVQDDGSRYQDEWDRTDPTRGLFPGREVRRGLEGAWSQIGDCMSGYGVTSAQSAKAWMDQFPTCASSASSAVAS